MRDPKVARAFDYEVFGLRVRSEVALPELFPAEGEREPDVCIAAGTVPQRPGWVHDGALVLEVRGVARYRIERGAKITFEPEPGVPDRNVRLYLMGSAFGALLHQRGLLPLHANAVEIDGRAVAFIGESGSGKSTLAAWFHDRGYKVIADDVCVIDFDDDGVPFACPGLPRLRLWDKALAQSGRDARTYERSYVDAAEPLEKFDVPIDRSAVAHSSVRLAAVYQLRRGDEFAITDLEGVDAANALFANTYRGAFVPRVKGQQAHWESAIKLLRAVPVLSFVRRWNLAELDEQCRRLVEHVESAVADHAGS